MATKLKRLKLHLAQAEAAARLQVVQTEFDAREAEIEVLDDATGSASKLLATDRRVLRKMRYADAESGGGRSPRGRGDGLPNGQDGRH